MRHLHLAEGRALEGTVVVAVARGPRGEIERHELREVGHRGIEPAHDTVGPVGERRLQNPVLVETPVASGNAVARHRRRVPLRERHSQWLQDLAINEVTRAHARDPRHHLTEDRKAGVRVFVAHAGCLREREALAHPSGERRIGLGELAISPRIVLGEALGMSQQVTDRDRWRVGRGVRKRLQFGHVSGHRSVERELALVPQLHDGHRGEVLCHGGDAEDAVGHRFGVGRDITDARGPRVHQCSVDDHAPRDAGRRFTLREVQEGLVDLGEGARQFGGAVGICEASGRRALRRRAACGIRPVALWPSGRLDLREAGCRCEETDQKSRGWPGEVPNHGAILSPPFGGQEVLRPPQAENERRASRTASMSFAV